MKGMALLSRALFFASLAVVTASSFGQGDTPPTVKLSVDGPNVLANKPFNAVLSVTFADGLHAYQNPPSADTFIPVVVKVDGKTFSVVAVKYPKGVPAKVAGEDKPINIYSGTIKIPVTLKAPAKLGSYDLKLEVSYQQCNEGSCFPPSTVNAKATVKVSNKLAKPAATAVGGNKVSN